MPRMRGDAACEALRRSGCSLPILAVSANATAADSDILLARGFDGLLAKPFTATEMRHAIMAARAHAAAR